MELPKMKHGARIREVQGVLWLSFLWILLQAQRQKTRKILGGLGCLCAAGGLFRSFRRNMNPGDDSNTSTRSLFPCQMSAPILLPGWNEPMYGSHMALPLLQSDLHPNPSPQRILWGVDNPIKSSNPPPLHPCLCLFFLLDFYYYFSLLYVHLWWACLCSVSIPSYTHM